MAANHTDVDQFPTVVVASDGDPVNQGAWRNADGPLADRTFFLRKRTRGSETGEEIPVPMICGPGAAANFTWDSPQMEWRQNSVASAGVLFIDLTGVVPKNAVIKSVTAHVIGAAGHAALPGTMPTLTLYRKDTGTQGNATNIGSQADASGSTGAYQVVHSITIGGLSEVVAHDSGNRNYLTFEGEAGSNSAVNLRLLGLVVVVDPA